MTDYTPPLFDHALDQDELNRMLLWRQQRVNRQRFRAQLQARLYGDPNARLNAQHAWQPLADYALDRQALTPPEDPDTQPPSNQDLNT
jgi:hypothetical protein